MIWLKRKCLKISVMKFVMSLVTRSLDDGRINILSRPLIIYVKANVNRSIIKIIN